MMGPIKVREERVERDFGGDGNYEKVVNSGRRSTTSHPGRIPICCASTKDLGFRNPKAAKFIVAREIGHAMTNPTNCMTQKRSEKKATLHFRMPIVAHSMLDQLIL
jgi:hypothetical protein